MAINILLEVQFELTTTEDGGFPCIQALGDSTLAIGWLHCTSSLDHNTPQVALHLASVLIHHSACLPSQHIKGDENVIADLFCFTSQERAEERTILSHTTTHPTTN
jgi:hypothetical protein